jgi:hypothetical protein
MPGFFMPELRLLHKFVSEIHQNSKLESFDSSDSFIHLLKHNSLLTHYMLKYNSVCCSN